MLTIQARSPLYGCEGAEDPGKPPELLREFLGLLQLDMSHICSGSLIGYFTNKENHHGTQTQRRIQA